MHCPSPYLQPACSETVAARPAVSRLVRRLHRTLCPSRNRLAAKRCSRQVLYSFAPPVQQAERCCGRPRSPRPQREQRTTCGDQRSNWPGWAAVASNQRGASAARGRRAGIKHGGTRISVTVGESLEIFGRAGLFWHLHKTSPTWNAKVPVLPPHRRPPSRTVQRPRDQPRVTTAPPRRRSSSPGMDVYCCAMVAGCASQSKLQSSRPHPSNGTTAGGSCRRPVPCGTSG